MTAIALFPLDHRLELPPLDCFLDSVSEERITLEASDNNYVTGARNPHGHHDLALNLLVAGLGRIRHIWNCTGSSLYSGAFGSGLSCPATAATIDDGVACAAGAAADWAHAAAQTKSPTAAIVRKTHMSHELYPKILADWHSSPFVKSDRNFSLFPAVITV